MSILISPLDANCTSTNIFQLNIGLSKLLEFLFSSILAASYVKTSHTNVYMPLYIIIPVVYVNKTLLF